MSESFLQILLLLGCAVAVVLLFLRLRVPPSLGYLLVGVLLGPHTLGPTIDPAPIQAIAEFGIVFLLFTIGLNFSLPQIHALRHLVLGLGTAQVLLTTVAVGLAGWAIGIAPVAAFVVGAVFAQSSTTVISKQLADQGEDNARHARLGVAMSVFQDVTAVPFVVIFPVLAAASALAMGMAVGLALAKAVLAFALVFFAGRWLLRPLLQRVAALRSAELFTLTVLFVALAAGAVTQALGLSMAFGAFLAGMVLGDTEFRHQLEATMRPFRDVLLGLFFVGVGALFDPSAMLRVGHWALLGAVVLMTVKGAIVAVIVHRAGIDLPTAWRTGVLLSVGGEFGFALLAIGLQSQMLDAELGQIVLASVLLSMIAGPVLIRYNREIAAVLTPRGHAPDEEDLRVPATQALAGHVLVAGYGRIGQAVGHVLESEGIAYAALDTDPTRVREARAVGEPVHYGDSAQVELLEALGLGAARLLVITHDDTAAATRTLQQVRLRHPQLPVMARTRDMTTADELRAAGATDAVPEMQEAGLMMGSQVLLELGLPPWRVLQRMQAERKGHYHHLRELIPGDPLEEAMEDSDGSTDRLQAVQLPEASPHVGQPLAALPLEGVALAALVRSGRRRLQPDPATRMEAGDTLVLLGPPETLARAEERILAG